MSEYYRESLDLNKNLKINYKQSLEATIGNILKCCFNDRGIDVEMETFSALLQTMNALEFDEDNSVFCSYDLDSNTILFNKNKNIDKSYGSPGRYDGEVIETMEDLFLLALFEIYTNCVL